MDKILSNLKEMIEKSSDPYAVYLARVSVDLLSAAVPQVVADEQLEREAQAILDAAADGSGLTCSSAAFQAAIDHMGKISIKAPRIDCEFKAIGTTFIGNGGANPITFGPGGAYVDLSGWTCYAPGITPVQPAAVPDGIVKAIERSAENEEKSFKRWHKQHRSVDRCAARQGWKAHASRTYYAFHKDYVHAAPAAQGDAKDAELDRIKRLATCGTVDSFLLLPEQDKRYWFAMAWQESDLRKLSEERIAFLHSTNKDADGYEFGIAKVKFDAAGKIESFLWGLGDNSDLDAAIASKAAS